jgi:hypothetical protein
MRFQHWFHELLRSLFFRKDAERDLNDEIRDHIVRETAENIALGLPPLEARRRAVLAFDGIERSKEECRDQSGIRVIKDLVQDLRYGSACYAARPYSPVSPLSRWVWESAQMPPSSAVSTPS